MSEHSAMVAAVERHAKHDIRDCDCGPAVVLLVLHLRAVAEWIAGLDLAAIAKVVEEAEEQR